MIENLCSDQALEKINILPMISIRNMYVMNKYLHIYIIELRLSPL